MGWFAPPGTAPVVPPTCVHALHQLSNALAGKLTFAPSICSTITRLRCDEISSSSNAPAIAAIVDARVCKVCDMCVWLSGCFPCPVRCPTVPQSLVRIPETLMCAMEFITLYTPPEHSGPLEELRKLVSPAYPDLMARSNKTFWQRKVGKREAHACTHTHTQ